MEKKVILIQDAIFEAHRFITRAREWQDRLSEDKYAVYGSKEGGACKRASMDLTRSLARLRR